MCKKHRVSNTHLSKVAASCCLQIDVGKPMLFFSILMWLCFNNAKVTSYLLCVVSVLFVEVVKLFQSRETQDSAVRDKLRHLADQALSRAEVLKGFPPPAKGQ